MFREMLCRTYRLVITIIVDIDVNVENINLLLER